MKKLFTFFKLVTKKIAPHVLLLTGGFSGFAALAWVIGFVSIKIGVPVAKGSFIEHPNLGTGMAMISVLSLVSCLAFLAYFLGKCAVTSLRQTWEESGYKN
jgi:hypothetical protein